MSSERSTAQVEKELDAARTELAELEKDRPVIKRQRDQAAEAARKARGKGNAEKRADLYQRHAGFEAVLAQHDRDIETQRETVKRLEGELEAAGMHERMQVAWEHASSVAAETHDRLLEALDTIRHAYWSYQEVERELQDAGVIVSLGSAAPGFRRNVFNGGSIPRFDDPRLFNAARDVAKRMRDFLPERDHPVLKPNAFEGPRRMVRP